MCAKRGPEGAKTGSAGDHASLEGHEEALEVEHEAVDGQDVALEGQDLHDETNSTLLPGAAKLDRVSRVSHLDDPVFGRMNNGQTDWSAEVAFPGPRGTVTVFVAVVPTNEHRERFLHVRSKWNELLALVFDRLGERIARNHDGIAVLAERIELGSIHIEADPRVWSAQFCYRHEDGADDDFGFFVDREGDLPGDEIGVVD